MAAQSPGQHRELFARIEEGMAVYDGDGKRVGKVVDCYPGGETLADLATLPADSPLGAVPREYRSRLAHEGFVEIAVGFLGGHRYATGSQVAGVEGGRVQLNIAGDELLRK